MPTLEVAEAANVRGRLDRAGHDAFKSAANLHFERVDHGVGGLADRNHYDAARGLQIKKIFKNAQNAAFAIHVPLKCPINAGFSESMLEEMARGDTHVESKALAIRGHGRILYEGRERAWRQVLFVILASFLCDVYFTRQRNSAILCPTKAPSPARIRRSVMRSARKWCVT